MFGTLSATRRHRFRLRAALVSVGIAFAVASCGAGSADETTGAGSDAIECGSADHPCALSEVPIATIRRTLELGEEAGAIIRDGGTTADAAAMLESENAMADVTHDDDALRFRLDGGRELWIYANDTEGARSGVGGASTAPAAIPHTPVLGEVVNHDREAKSAIVLSPSLYEFGANDEGSAVAAILGGARGYEGRVTYLANETKTSGVIGISTYKNLDHYDVIHISTHGAVLCADDGSGCEGSLQAFDFAAISNSLPGTTAEEKVKAITEKGVALGFDAKTKALGVILLADFFRTYYPAGGISDAMIVVSACETMAPGGADLVQAMTGPNSVYVGWDADVRSDYAAEASKALHTHLAVGGYTADDAYDEVGALTTPPDGAVMRIFNRATDADVRIREVVRLLDPATTEPLTSGTAVDVDGVAADDIDDAVPWAVTVDGVKAEDAPSTNLRITIDGVEISRAVASGTRNDSDQWLLEGTLDLGYDLKENTAVDIEAVVELAEGGESDDLSSIELITEVEGSWSLQVDYTFTDIHDGESSVKSTGSAYLVLEPAETQLFDDRTEYVVVGGSATVDHNYATTLCIQTGPVLSWEVTPELAAGSTVTVDMSQSPPVMWAFVQIEGPEFSGEIRCRAGTGADADPDYKDPEPTSFDTNPLFLAILKDNAIAMNAEGTSASGTAVDEATGDFGWISESTFVFQRATE